ncbi:Coiled-coil domain-containing protein 162 [Clonorchis sinensis]|uniref:Coiled-coil domain-containing protein 162 n=1 Tax=Clonorchis sinensis TaxID=79923 RepID=A0A8T1MPU8_CLOSI|nr:Coiled-coil domain-containing protein 162 [Clonorchis sinensis]
MDEDEDVLKTQEDGLRSDILELRAQIEENELIHGIPSKGMSSVYIPKDPDYFRRERKLILQRTLQVLEPKPITLQAELMMQELDACSQREFTEKTLPILLHQYFIDRIHQIVLLKHGYLLRWKRYCSSTAAVETIQAEYLNRLEYLTNEYLDASSRAHRLASTREGILANSDNGVEDVTVEDYQIYLRYHLSHLQSLSYANQLLNIIKWLPYSHRDRIKDSLIKQYPYILCENVTNVAPRGGFEAGGTEAATVNLTKTQGAVEREMSVQSMSADEGEALVAEETETLRSGQRASSEKGESGAPPSQPVEASVILDELKAMEQAHAVNESMFDETNTATTACSSPSSIKKKSVQRKSLTNVEDSDDPLQGQGSETAPAPHPQSHFRFSEQAPQPPAMMHATVIGANAPLQPTKANFDLASSGGGIVTNDKVAAPPLHSNDLETLRPHLVYFCHAYGIQMNIQAIRSSADEMELFAVINRKFRQIFGRQEEMLTFKTYDSAKSASERWGLDSWVRAVRKPSNWLPYVKLRPRRHEYLVKLTMELRSGTVVDDLLKASANFLKMKSPEKVQDSLRHHAMLVQHPPIVHSASVVSHRQGQSTAEIFKKIYNNSDFFGKTSADTDDSGKRQDDYDFTQAMQMLGLDDATNAKDDPSSVQGAYLSYLHLRHLKLRDVMRTCISVLNYFRSIERTLTINDQGLSMNSRGGVERTSPPNHRVGTEAQGHKGGGNTIDGHGYLFNSPQEFKIKETEFMQFAEVDNHDDFYFHEEGRIHVRDQVGFWIVYDAALEDFNKLEQDLLLWATAFIQKDRQSRTSSNTKKKGVNQEAQSSDLDIARYAHRDVDRFGVLYDIWINECAFQQAKQKLMDVYMEVYGHIISRDSRRRLAQIMTNLMYQRPRLDLNESYFVLAYRYECAILRQRTEIMRCILNHQILNQREYLKKIHVDKPEFGLPPPLLERFPIAVHSDETLLTPVYLLEFHPSLSCAPSLAAAMDQSVQQLYELFTPNHPMQEIVLEKRFYDFLRYEVETLKPLGGSYTAQLQRDLFSSYFVEDAIQMCELSNQHLAAIQNRNSRGDKKTRQMYLLNELGRLLDLVTLRHRLIDCMWECEVLSKIYLTVAHEMGFDDFHLFIRPLQFEAAKYKEGADDLRPPIYITAVQDDDSMLDKFLPSALPLAIHELDETHVGKFSFRGKVTIMEMLETRGVENMLTILKVQTAHKNALTASVMLAYNARPSFYTMHAPKTKTGILRPSNTGANLISYTGLSGTQVGPTPLALERSKHQLNADYHPEAFFSIQLEKSPSRDRTQNAFIKRTQGGGIASSKSSVESEKMKREFISQFCMDFGQRTQHISLRAQIISTYSSILTILEKVPTVTEDFFVIGCAFEKKNPEDDLDVQVTDPRALRTRPRRVLSTDGTKLYNFWFIPHFIEVLFVFRHLDDVSCTKALQRMARLACVLHDILHYLIAYARLGISSAKITPEQRQQVIAGSQKHGGQQWRTAVRGALPTAAEVASNIAGTTSAETFVAQLSSAGTIPSMNMVLSSPALSVTPLDLSVHGRSLVVDQIIEDLSDFDGGPMSMLATELREIQYQINRLPDPTDPEQVIQMLDLRRDVMFLQFDVCMRTILRETFLAAGNVEAYKEVVENSHFPLSELSDVQRPCLNAIELNVPEPLEARDDQAKALFPWRSLMNRCGPFLLFCFGPSTIEYNIHLCLAGLKPVDRPTVHGELLAMNLCLEDVLDVGDIPEAKAGEPMPIQQAENMHCMLGKRTRDRRREIPPPNAASPTGTGGPASTPGSVAGTTNPANATGTSINTMNITHSSETQGQKSSTHGGTGGAGPLTTTADKTPKMSTLDSPVAAYTLLKKFLILWKRVELLKYAWGRRRLGVESINNPNLFKTFCSIYKREKLYPLIRSLAIQYRQPDMYALGPLDATDIIVMPKGIPEMVVRQRQLLKLIEAFEFYMIADLRKLLVRQTDLVIKERNREEGNLPLELWKRPAMKETLSVKRPGLADEFLVELMSHLEQNARNDTYTITKDKLNEVLQTVAISVMRTQRESYENYSMYYENLLKNQHSLLYAKEREIETLKETLRQNELETNVTVQFQMSEQAHNLLLEVTALRAKIAELEDINLKTEAKVRSRVRREFSVAMRKLFGLSFEQKSRIDQYRDHLHAITLQRIAEVREEASAEMARIKERSGARASAEDELAERNLRLSREVNTLHQRNIGLQQMMSRLRVMAHWQQTTLRCAFEKQISGVEEQRNQSKSQVTRLGILSEQRVRMLNEEMSKLRDHLSNTEKHLNDMRKALDKEMSDKVEKRHAAERKAATDKQMAMVKQMHIDQLMAEIAEKNATLEKMGSLLDASAKSKKQEADKSVREVDLLRKQLREERKLKKSAIHKVDDLMSQLYEFETAYSSGQNRPGVNLPTMTPKGEATAGGARKMSAEIQRPVTYEDLVAKKSGPYTPKHYLRFRQETARVPQIRERLAQQILRNCSGQTHMHFLRMHDDSEME